MTGGYARLYPDVITRVKFQVDWSKGLESMGLRGPTTRLCTGPRVPQHPSYATVTYIGLG